MNRSLLSLSLNPYLALLIVMLVSYGAGLALLRSIEVAAEYAAYLPGA